MLLVAEIVALSVAVAIFIFSLAVLIGCIVFEGGANEKYHN